MLSVEKSQHDSWKTRMNVVVKAGSGTTAGGENEESGELMFEEKPSTTVGREDDVRDERSWWTRKYTPQ